MILCSSPLAKTPFELNNGQLKIFSLEELCCFYHENEFYMDRSIVNMEFVDWVRQELGLSELAKRLQSILEKDEGVNLYFQTVFESNDYLTRERISEILYAFSQYDSVTGLEKRKYYADSLLRNGQYEQAIIEYYRLLEEVQSDDKKLMGKLMNNLGVAYGRLFRFSQALKAFERAYELTLDDRVLDEIALTKKLLVQPAMGDSNDTGEIQEITDERLEELKEEYRRMMR